MSEKKSTFDRPSKKDRYESVEMPSRFGASKKSNRESIEMPSSFGSDNKRTVNLPGFGEVERDKVQALKRGGKVSSASKRADGCAVKGKTKGRMV
jgi:hypothetical protein